MGVCLSRGHGHHHHGHMLANDEDSGFCTPEGVSSQNESRNPSGRYSFANLESPQFSADIGDFGALGSLFYKRGSRSRNHQNMVSNYISPLDMFLGGVSGRNRVHHVNQLCAGDYSFASYLASSLLKGFDVHAMEAVAKSYVESAAKAAARDAFVFLEENDISVVSSSSRRLYDDAEECNVPTSSAALEDDSGDDRGDDCGDDDDLAKSGESDEWEKQSINADNSWVVQNEEAEIHNFKKSSSSFWEEEAGKSIKLKRSSSRSREPNERWLSVLNAVQARAKARRRQRRKSSLAKPQVGSSFQRSGSGRKPKIVRFRLAGAEEGFTDDEPRSGKEFDHCQASPEDKEQAEIVNNSSVEVVKGATFTTARQNHPDEVVGDDCVDCLDRSFYDEESGATGEQTSIAEEGSNNYYIWHEEEEGDNGGGEDDGFYGKEKIIEAELSGFSFTSSRGFDGVQEPSQKLNGAATPLMGPRAGPPSVDARHVHRPSIESFSSSEYFLPETSFGSSDQMEEEVLLEDFLLPPSIDEDDIEVMSFGNDPQSPRGQDDGEEDDEGGHFIDADEGDDQARLCCSADCGECEAAAAAAFPPGPSSDGDSNIIHHQQEMPTSVFTKNISVSNDSPPPVIQVGCVVVESRLPDGSRLTPQILDLSEVHLPERGEDNYGYFHARVLCHSGISSPPTSSDQKPDVEGGFSFPVLSQHSSSSQPTESSSGRETECPSGLWRAPPLGDAETPIKSRSIRPHPSPAEPLPPPPMLTNPVLETDEINSSPPECTIFDDRPSSTSIDSNQTVTKRTHEIVLPTVSSRSMSATPVFSPSKVTTTSLRSKVAAAASTSPFLSTVQASSIPYPPRARRSLNKKLKFYSLERASYAAAGGKRSKSPPSFSRHYRERKRDTDGESDSDLFEIETMSGTNAMGSSRTPPSTPTKNTRNWTAPAPIDLEKLSDSIAKVSRSLSKRSSNRPAPTVMSDDSKARCLPLERRKDSSVFQGKGGTNVRPVLLNSLKGRALLKLGHLVRSAKQYPHIRSDFRRDLEPFKSSEAYSVSEYIENKPPSPAGRYQPHGNCGQCVFQEERAVDTRNYAFEWYCSTLGQRMAPLHHEKRLHQQQGFSSHKSFSNEDRTFAVKN